MTLVFPLLKILITMISRAIAVILLILLLPLCCVITSIILVEDGYPFIFVQKRIGYNKFFFNIYKFRTMKTYTPNMSTNLFKNENNFILKSGIIIRKLSLDEIPNLLNIIKGEMKFIGPRPAIPSQKKLIESRLVLGIYNHYPGITGLAQVNGRDNLNDDEKVYFEKKYLANKSIILNFKIIVLTIIRIFKFNSVKH